jgi:effector-binding domain-containing protein
MIDTPEVLDTKSQPLAAIHITVPRAEIRSAMEAGRVELAAVLKAQGITPAGPWLTHHHHMDPAVFDFSLGVPVDTPVASSGRVAMSELPAAKVARTIYRGGYEGLGAAWGELDAWIRANGHSPAPNIWERYVTGPESGSDPSKWVTELNHPLKASAES